LKFLLTEQSTRYAVVTVRGNVAELSSDTCHFELSEVPALSTGRNGVPQLLYA